MTRHPLYRPGGHQVRSGRMRKISPPPAFDPRTVQPGTSRSTGYAIPAHENAKAILITAVPTAHYTCADTLFLPYLHRRRCVLQTKAETRFRAYENNSEYTGDNTKYLRRCELNNPSIWFFNFFSVSAEKTATNYVTKKDWRYCLMGRGAYGPYLATTHFISSFVAVATDTITTKIWLHAARNRGRWGDSIVRNFLPG
jgi:hypothetical protein